MKKYLISLASLLFGFNMAFSQTSTKVDVTPTPTSDTPTQAETRKELKEAVSQKETDGWEVMNTEATIYVPTAENELQESINKEGATILSKEEFDRKFKGEDKKR